MTGKLFVSIDDTDVRGGEGTGKLARRIVEELSLDVEGITRHQLYVHPSIKYTKMNSCNVIISKGDEGIWDSVREIVLRKHQDGSDPGLAMANEVPEPVKVFGGKAQREVLLKEEAMRVATEGNINLEEIGGSGEGIIGALAGIGLCSTGQDGRYIMLPGMRELKGTVSVDELTRIGVTVTVIESGKKLEKGDVILSDQIRPKRVAGEPVLLVEEGEGAYYPLKL